MTTTILFLEAILVVAFILILGKLIEAKEGHKKYLIILIIVVCLLFGPILFPEQIYGILKNLLL